MTVTTPQRCFSVPTNIHDFLSIGAANPSEGTRIKIQATLMGALLRMKHLVVMWGINELTERECAGSGNLS